IKAYRGRDDDRASISNKDGISSCGRPSPMIGECNITGLNPAHIGDEVNPPSPLISSFCRL
ncbi:hypothetical protein PCK04_28085, partial [Klebsiella pneumoniae]|uniref:hypothetical protein n=1 Tax=Klebsiella pneumoniae TaxID=573 RepID=UPI0023B02AE2